MGASGMQPAAPILHEVLTTQAVLSNPGCLDAFYPGLTSAYLGSGETAISIEQLHEPGNTPNHLVEQAAVGFPSADRALAFVQTSAGKWRACAGQTITTTVNGQNNTWTLADLVGDATAITQLRTKEGGNGAACQRALRAVLNVVLDVRACGTPISDQAGRIAEKMASTATQQAH
jgi:serine/threonine-protein kinase